MRGWTATYTAGLRREIGQRRRDEIESDLAEHEAARRDDGHLPRRIARERLWRLARGVHADVGWRRDILRAEARSTPTIRTLVTTTATATTLAIVAFHTAFAAYILGDTSLADSTYALGGMESYGDMVGTSPIFAGVLVVTGVMLLAASIARPAAPLSANLIAATISLWWVMWFWLRMWPVALVVVFSSVADLILRVPGPESRSRLDPPEPPPPA